ncbi:MAG: hypothetical protein ACFFC7_34935 [Candidatus Hermodarchaeota archaeon]
MSEKGNKEKHKPRNYRKRKIQDTREIIVLCCVLLYFWSLLAIFINCISGCIGAIDKPFGPFLIRFPLGYPGAIGIDQNHNLYYVDNTYNRLKVYDREGHFLRSWHVPVSGVIDKSQRLIIEDSNHIYVETGYVRENPQKILYTVYNHNGRIIEEDSKKYADLYDFSAHLVADTEGNIFRANESFFFPKVFQINSSGHEFTFISDPFYLRIFAVGPNYVLFAGSILIGGYLAWEQKKLSNKKTDFNQGTEKG